ncbi:MAG: hypothetical protein Ct9H300mP28_36090 [Pseudomonadota bacterium]|nr:MAG: hypothetical protein Ct9H300mP28_36090 [Pseudomonadota bacterium]
MGLGVTPMGGEMLLIEVGLMSGFPGKNCTDR